MAASVMRISIAAAISPLAVPVLDFAGTVLFSGYVQQGPGHFWKLVQLMLVLGPISYVTSLGVGVPVILILYRFECLTPFYVLLCGTLCGVIVGLGFDVLINWRQVDEMMKAIAFFGVFGGIAGFLTSGTFCVLSGIGGASPSRSQKVPRGSSESST